MSGEIAVGRFMLQAGEAGGAVLREARRAERAHVRPRPAPVMMRPRLARDQAQHGDRAKVLATAAHLMRHILVDHARAHRAAKRGGGAVQVTFDENLEVAGRSAVNVLAVDEALTRLGTFDPRQAQILELHFFAGLGFQEIALQLGVSERTVKRDWTMARAWLRQELSPIR